MDNKHRERFLGGGYRSAKRQAQHEAAHSEADDAAPHIFLDHHLVPSNHPHLVSEQGELEQLIATLRAEGRFAYDTEFIGEQTYNSVICLIQVATQAGVSLIDPLAGIDLKPFWSLLADASIEKVVHAGRQDFEPVYAVLGRTVANVFDTQIAAGFCGLGYPKGLADLVEVLLDTQLEQGPKFSQWNNRPLTERQMGYAANDVRYLLLLRKKIIAQLQDRDRLDWAIAECRTLEAESLYAYTPDVRKLKATSVGRMSRRHQTILIALMNWRESMAKSLDIPPRAFIPDQSLVDIVLANLQAPEAIQNIKGLPRPIKSDYAGKIIEVIQHAATLPLVAGISRNARDSDAMKNEIASRWDALTAHCEEIGIERQLIANRREFATLVRALVREKPIHVPHLITGWRREVLLPIFEDYAERFTNSDPSAAGPTPE